MNTQRLQCFDSMGLRTGNKHMFPARSCLKTYRVEASNYTLKIITFVNIWYSMQFREKKKDILSTAAKFSWNLKRILLHTCATYNCDFLQQTIIPFSPNRFPVWNSFFSSQFRIFPLYHLVLLRDRFLKKMLLKRAKTRRFFFFFYFLFKSTGLNIFLTLIEIIVSFKMFEF